MPVSDIDKIKNFTRHYLQQRGLPVRKSFRCINPAHEDKHPSMRYNEKTENVHCFACGATYDLFDIVGIDYNLLEFRDQYDKVCDIFGLGNNIIQYEEIPENNGNKFCLMDDKTQALKDLANKSDGLLDYFLARGISEESCRKYRLFHNGGRAYFPVVEDDKCTGWTARAVDQKLEPRYKNSSGPLGLWNGDYLKQNGRGKCLFITEGIVDAILLEQMGESAVALCGSQNTGKLLRRCEENIKWAGTWRFVACGDPDEAGEKMNRSLSEGFRQIGIICEILALDSADGDVSDLYGTNPERLRLLLDQFKRERLTSIEYSDLSAASAIEDFFDNTREGKKAISTGLTGVDKLLDGGLYAGLYVVGAISSLGKTSFILQIADYIAGNNQDVIFFSLEQSRFELMAKSLSRISAQIDSKDRRKAYTARQLLSGKYSGNPKSMEFLIAVSQSYKQRADRIFIREGIADIGAEEIRQAVREHREQRGVLPVVIVDYLQILKPVEARATDKQNTDRSVVELKRISRDFDIPVIAISSFNRENYKAAVSMEAFKESGAVEYSSDVLFGLQLAGAGERDFDANRAKIREPRKIELVMLKNRNGIPYAKLALNYYAKFSLFEE